MKVIDTIAYMLIQDGHILAEKRKLTKAVCPGAVSIPGGHVESGETAEEALIREVEEEVGLRVGAYRFVCTLLHKSTEYRKLDYFLVDSWQGEMQNNEAEALLWIPLGGLDDLDLEVDRVAVREYLRVYGEGA